MSDDPLEGLGPSGMTPEASEEFDSPDPDRDYEAEWEEAATETDVGELARAELSIPPIGGQGKTKSVVVEEPPNRDVMALFYRAVIANNQYVAVAILVREPDFPRERWEALKDSEQLMLYGKCLAWMNANEMVDVDGLAADLAADDLEDSNEVGTPHPR